MKPYRFLAASNQSVVIEDDEISFRPVLADWSLRRQHWARAEIIAVITSPSGSRTRRCEVSVTSADGTVRRFRNVRADAGEVATAFHVRGFPVR
jgi:hypothetical protein